MDLSICIVGIEQKELLYNCISSIYKHPINYLFEIIYVDNGSRDDTVFMVNNCFPDVKVIQLDINYGFSKANNEAFKRAKGEYILMLNNDIVVHENAINQMIKYIIENSNIGIVGGRLLNLDGSIEKSCHRDSFFSPVFILASNLGFAKISKYFKQYLQRLFYNNLVINDVIEVDNLSGANILIKKDLLVKVGLLDEQFKFYLEDSDLCLRIRALGYKIIYFPSATFTHYYNSTINKYGSYKWVQLYESYYLCLKLHKGLKYAFLMRALISLSCSLRALLSIFYSKNNFIRFYYIFLWSILIKKAPLQ